MIDRSADIIPLPPPKPLPPDDDSAVHPDLIVPSQIWLEGPLPKRPERPLGDLIPFPPPRAPSEAGADD